MLIKITTSVDMMTLKLLHVHLDCRVLIVLVKVWCMSINLMNQHTCWSSYLAIATYPMRPLMILLESHFLQVALLTPLYRWLSYAYLTSYPHPCFIPWASQVHLVLVGITFVVVLYYGIVIADLGAATEPGVPGGVCCSHMVVLLGACRRRGTCYHDPSWTHTSELS